MKKTFSIGLLIAVIALCCGTAAKADTLTIGDLQITGTVTDTLATLTFQCLDATCAGWFLGDVTLKGFTFNSPTLGTAPAGYTLVNGGQDNNAVGNGGGCNGTPGNKALCWDAALPLTTVLGNGLITFTAHIGNGGAGTLHVQATGYDNAGGNEQGGGKVFAISEDLGSGGGTTVPEPATISLLGTGLLALAGITRRRFLNS